MEAGTNLEGYKEAASAGHCRVAKILEFGAVINTPTATNSRYGTEKTRGNIFPNQYVNGIYSSKTTR